jgi:hypothetical protein
LTAEPVQDLLVSGAGSPGDQPLGGLAHGVRGQGGPPVQVLDLLGALGVALVPREAPADDERREPQGTQQAEEEPHGGYAPNFVSLIALAMTRGMRWWAGSSPRVPAAQARSVNAVTGSAPQ